MAMRAAALPHVVVQIDEDDLKDDPKNDLHCSVEYFFGRLIWFSKLHGTYFGRESSWKLWITNGIVNVVAIGIAISATIHEVSIVMKDGIEVDLESSTMLCGLVWTSQSIISLLFLIWWQVSGSLWSYFDSIADYQRGECVIRGLGLLKRRLYLARITGFTVMALVILYNYGPTIEEDHLRKYEISHPLYKLLYAIATLHLFFCWSQAIFLYNILIDGAFLEVQYFNSQLSSIKDDICNQLLHMLTRHSRISKTIGNLDQLFKVYSFVMVTTMIPCTLLTLTMLAHRVDDYVDVLIFGLPSMGITIYGFLGITLAPARLYEEVLRSKSCLCQNLNIWYPYREQAYRLALAMSSHLEQPNLGMTIWGFAVLSKPLILATFSGMIMVLSLLLEIVPTIEEIVEEAEEEAAAALLNRTMTGF